LPNRRAALQMNLPNLTARETNLAPVALLRHELGGHASGTAKLTTAALLQLDVVNRGAERDEAQRQAVAGLDVGMPAGNHRIADLQAIGSQNVRLHAVRVMQKRDTRRAVRIVLNRR